MFCLRLLCSIALALPGLALAQGAGDYPNRPVNIIVAVAAGGTTDIETRLYAIKLQETFGRPFIVDYKPGAGSTIGAAYVAKAAPDGYTLLTLTPSHTVSPLIYPNLSYEVTRDFAPIGLASKRPSLITVPVASPFKTFKDYAAYAKQKPTEINFGTSGAGSASHLALEWLHSLAGLQVTYVHFKGGGPSLQALLQGQLHIVISSAGGTLPHLKAGKVRVLAVTTMERTAALPDVPSLHELGYSGFEYAQWIGLVAPAKTPLAIRERLSGELARIVKLPEIGARLAGDGTIMIGSAPDQFGKYIADEAARWRKVVADTGIKLSN
jgi:tripartite-type tricarboxylate transporter receptor subunit TctC